MGIIRIRKGKRCFRPQKPHLGCWCKGRVSLHRRAKDPGTMAGRSAQMKRKPTLSEFLTARLLKENSIPFESQVIIGRFIVDFLIGSLVIEVDGSTHNSRYLQDRTRDEKLKAQGYNILHIPNRLIQSDPALTLQMIRSHLLAKVA